MHHRVCNRINIFKKHLRIWSTRKVKKLLAQSGLIAMLSPPEKSPLCGWTTSGLVLTLTLQRGGKETEVFSKILFLQFLKSWKERTDITKKRVRETVGLGEDKKIASLYCCSHIYVQVEDTLIALSYSLLF